MSILIDRDPFLAQNIHKPWRERGLWPAHWVGCPGATPPFVAAFRLRFSAPQLGGEPQTARLHVTADERYELFLDGERIGRGPERGAPEAWFYESYDLHLTPGEHVLAERVWALGEKAPDAQMSIRPGFLLAAEGEWLPLLSTGAAAWEARLLDGYQFFDWPFAFWKGATLGVDGSRFPWGFESGLGDGWTAALPLAAGVGKRVDWELRPQHILTPAMLPPMLDAPVAAGKVRFVGEVEPPEMRVANSFKDEEMLWTKFVQGETSLSIPPHSCRRVLLELDDYYCAYPTLLVSVGAGSEVRIDWAEALFLTPNVWGGEKGPRDEVDGKYFVGRGDVFWPDGGLGRKFETLWWQAGRFIQVLVKTADQPLVLERFALQETRYPLEMKSHFVASDPRLERIVPLLTRGIQVNAHETYFDCPYYEEMQYAGDTRLEALTTYVMTSDDRLPRKALRLFDGSRLATGMTQSRYPCRKLQIIPSWTLWWVAMVRDYAYWRTDLDFVRALMPGVRATMEGFRRDYGLDGLLHAPEGWNNFDWVPAWDQDAGCPPDAVSGVSGVLNWHLIYTLTLYADLEERLGESLLSERAYWHAHDMSQKALNAFWDAKRGMLADDLAHQHFSEHTQCLALLSDLLDRSQRERAAEGLLTAPDLQRATVYFSHYLFETYRKLGRMDALFNRLPLWFDLAERGFKTPIEKPEPSRSDCHGWGAHPLYHYFATILGIRPGDLGFCSAEIIPQLGPLDYACGRLVHPGGGEIVLEVRRHANRELHGKLSLPPGVDAMLHVNGKIHFFRDETKEF